MPPTLPVSYSSVSLMMLTLPDIGSASTLTSASIANFAGMAEADINARISRAYNIPFTSDVPYLTTVATTKALLLLLSRRLIPLPGPRLTELLDQYRTVDEEIAAIASGLIPLVTSSGAVIGGRTDIADIFSTTMNYTPTFHEGPSTWQVQDPNKVTDELDKRDITTKSRLLDNR